MSSIVQELRRTRRERRLGQLEWFDIAYRAYLVAFVGGGLVIWASGVVRDIEVSASQLDDVVTRGPSVLGLAAAVAVALGLRSGSDGGPVALEVADVRHLLRAPLPRRQILARPVTQRLRAVIFAAGVVGGIGGLLAADRLPGSPAAWVASGAAAAACAGALFVAVAVLAHAVRLPRAAATVAAIAVLAAQGAAAGGWLPAGPGDTIGSLALWGIRQQRVDVAGVALVIAASAAAIVLAGHLRTEPLVRRADLVSQLRFAATMQDLRTVVLLRRQLRGEHARSTPWVRLPRRRGGPAPAVWQRGWRGLARYPTSRLVRMAGLSLAAGAAAVAVLRGTTPAVVGVGVALHLLGLDAVEPLSQEIDHPDHTDATPRPRGWLLVRHLAAPAVALVPFAMLAAAVVAAVEPERAIAAFALAVPVTLAGAAGAVVSVVRDAPDPVAAPASTAVPPEFAGFTTTMRVLWPLALSTLGALPVLAMRESPTAGTGGRSAVGAILFVAVVVWWVRRRDAWRRKVRSFLEEGRAAAGASR